MQHKLTDTHVESIAVGSTNPAKLAAARNAVSRIWPSAAVHSIEVESGVRPQPLSDEEAITGAINRARHARQAFDADLGIGIEGSTADTVHGLFSTAWIAVIDRHGTIGLGESGRFLLPKSVAQGVRSGGELGPLMDLMISEHNTKQRQGAVGIFTSGLISRSTALEMGVILALVRFLNPTYYAEVHRSDGDA